MKGLPFALVLVATIAPAALQDQASIEINGVLLKQKTLVIDGVSYIPVRAMTSALGGTTAYDDERKLIVVALPGQREPIARSLWTDLDAMSFEEVSEWAKRGGDWADRAEVALSLIDLDSLDIEDERLDRSVRSLVSTGSTAAEELSLLFLRMRIQEEVSLTLRHVETVNTWMEGLMSSLGTIPDICQRAGRGSRLPSPELRIRMTDLSTEGIKLSTEIIGHRRAVMLWYDAVTPHPPPEDGAR